MPVGRRLILATLSFALVGGPACVRDSDSAPDSATRDAVRAMPVVNSRDVLQARRTIPPAAGRLLVASRGLTDPNFAQSVLLLIEQGPDGAAGLIVNVRTAAPIAGLFGHLKLQARAGEVAYFGGPVAPRSALALVKSRQPVTGARLFTEDIHIVTNREQMEDHLLDGADADVFRVYLGHAGWTAGQLEREIALGAWHVFNADAAVVFDADPSSTWRRQIRRTELLEAWIPRTAAFR